MLIGHVTSEKEAVLSIEVLGPVGASSVVETTIDTGFNGYLTLPPSVVIELGLPFAGTVRATLGDGKEATLDLFLATIQWYDGPHDALILQAEGGALLGMAVLAGNRVTLEVVEDGAVTIEQL